MYRYANLVKVLCLATVVFVASCSSESEDTDPTGNDTSNNGSNSDGGGGNSVDGDNSGGDSNGGGNSNVDSGTFGPAQYNLAACGSLNILDLEASNNINAPTAFTVGQLVQGQLVKESSVLNFDVWQVDLPAGNYHLIVDGWEASDLDEIASVGVRVTSLGDTPDNDEDLYFEPISGRYTRGYEYLEIIDATTMTMKVEPIYDEAMNYIMGLIPNGSAVPVPRFSRCPSIERISLNETQSLTLPELSNDSDYRWFQLNLDAGVYKIDATMESSNRPLGYRFTLFQRFGDRDIDEGVVFEVSSNSPINSSDQFTVLDNAEVFLRVNNAYNNDEILEFTVTR